MLNAVDRRFFVPEVIQTSDMDCGPAALKALFEGFNVSLSYGRLREACQTQVDGSSIDTIEDVAIKLGMNAQQTMLPPDHLPLLEAAALPALVVVSLAHGQTHFVIVWRMHGPFAQVMDPSKGRRWVRWQKFVDEIFIHHFPISAELWRTWASQDEFLNPLRHRMRLIGITERTQNELIEAALEDPTWRGIAALDAKVRMLAALVDADGLNKGEQANMLLQSFTQNDLALIPAHYWYVSNPESPEIPPDHDELNQDLSDNAASNESESGEEIILHGAVLLRISGIRNTNDEDQTELPPELKAALTEKPIKPIQALWQTLRQDSPLIYAMLGLATFLAALGIIIETIFLQTISRVGNLALTLSNSFAPISALYVTLGLSSLLFFIDLCLSSVKQQIGRRLEMRLRIQFFEKIPRLGDRYFHSRLISDMTSRAHSLLLFRNITGQILSLVQTCFQLLFTLIGIYVLDASNWVFLILFTFGFGTLMTISRPLLQELEMRVSTLSNTLSRFYLDGMLGLTPLRTHGAERSFRREQEGLLTDWLRLSLANFKTTFRLDIGAQLFYIFVMVAIIINYIQHHSQNENTLLLLYWILNLPSLTQSAWVKMAELPGTYNALIRLLDPLGAPDEESGHLTDQQTNPPTSTTSPNLDQTGVQIVFNQAMVQAGGQTILHDIQLTIQAGEHIAIVGPSGAGKSSLVSLLLGWHKATQGEVLIDGVPLVGPKITQLRQQTAWVDPSIQLWNRTLIENLTYGNQAEDTPITDIIEEADLYDVLSRLPEGLQTVIGESGGLVSGGEGQRVRLARAMTRKNARLVILDEPFRGLDREKRRILLSRTRKYWAKATLICITHDVGETLPFDRVLVIENGQIAEDDHPTTLAAQPSRYQDLLNGEENMRNSLWANAVWRRVRIQDGSVVNTASKENREVT